MRQYREYSTKFRSCICCRLINEISHFFKMDLKRKNIKLILICLVLLIIYSLFDKNTPTTTIGSFSNQQKIDRTKPNAFIITDDCNSLRYNITKQNIELAFPDFFFISCYVFVPLNDSRIHISPIGQLKSSSSNLLTFLELWTYKIPDESKSNEYEWSFIFEDDINFINASQVLLTNFIVPLQELMNNPEIQQKHGFLYLGICGASFDNESQPLISKDTNNNLYSQKGCGFCRHATGITAKRAQLFWTEISSYRPDSDGSIDRILYNYCIRSRNYFYTFGTNFHYPPSTGHMGIAYQDPARFASPTNA